jgi:hypothetical protein
MLLLVLLLMMLVLMLFISDPNREKVSVAVAQG